MKKFFKDFILYFFLFYILFLGYNQFFGPTDETLEAKDNIVIDTSKSKITAGNLHTFEIENNTDSPLVMADACASPQNFQILTPVPNSVPVNMFKPEDCANVPTITVPAQQILKLSLPLLNQTYFQTAGDYMISVQFDGQEPVISDAFTIKEPGFLRRAFRTLITQPLFNVLVYFTTIFPANSFGLSIIVLTLLVRMLLFLPNQKAMKSQRRLQQLQPKLEALKTKYKDNKQMIAMETMSLYKKHKINPLSSCLPVLLQMPFLLGIYYIIRDGLSLHLTGLLYPSWGNSATELINANQDFLWLDLSIIDPYYILPVVVAAAQWGAVKLSLVHKKKQVSKKQNQPAPTGTPNQMEQMNKMMLYVMPLMIGFFAATFPAGVGIYWFTSTIFGAFQQWYVNKALEPKKGALKKVAK